MPIKRDAYASLYPGVDHHPDRSDSPMWHAPRCKCGARHRPDDSCASPMSAVRGCWPLKPCPRCAQMSDAAGLCQSCRRLERAPQGETVRLFTPAPNQMPGQLVL